MLPGEGLADSHQASAAWKQFPDPVLPPIQQSRENCIAQQGRGFDEGDKVFQIISGNDGKLQFFSFLNNKGVDFGTMLKDGWADPMVVTGDLHNDGPVGFVQRKPKVSGVPYHGVSHRTSGEP